MTRKALEAFDPGKLRKGRAQCFEVRNRQTGYGEHHYFYRDHDGELFAVVAHRRDTCEAAMKAWRELKCVNDQDLVPLCIQDAQTN